MTQEEYNIAISLCSHWLLQDNLSDSEKFDGYQKALEKYTEQSNNAKDIRSLAEQNNPYAAKRDSEEVLSFHVFNEGFMTGYNIKQKK